MRLRGMALSIKNVLRRPLYMLENMLVPFLLQSSAIVDEMSAAVMARGFDKDHPRSSFLEVKMKALGLDICCSFRHCPCMESALVRGEDFYGNI